MPKNIISYQISIESNTQKNLTLKLINIFSISKSYIFASIIYNYFYGNYNWSAIL